MRAVLSSSSRTTFACFTGFAYPPTDSIFKLNTLKMVLYTTMILLHGIMTSQLMCNGLSVSKKATSLVPSCQMWDDYIILAYQMVDHMTFQKIFNRPTAGLTNQPYMVYCACDTPLAEAQRQGMQPACHPAVMFDVHAQALTAHEK